MYHVSCVLLTPLRVLLLCPCAGKEVYVDVQGWHLFLKEITVEKDVKMHQVKAALQPSLLKA